VICFYRIAEFSPVGLSVVPTDLLFYSLGGPLIEDEVGVPHVAASLQSPLFASQFVFSLHFVPHVSDKFARIARFSWQ
jgi:hypothetical protein